MEYLSRNIYSGEILWQRAAESDAALQAAVRRLRAAQQDFAALDVTERCAQLAVFADKIAQNRETLAQMICEEVGRCLNECRAEIDKSAALIRYYVHLAPELLAPKTIATQAALSGVSFAPLGVVLAVMPWNYPVWQILRFAVPALCAGNACMVKPAPGVGRITAQLFAYAEDLPFMPLFIAHGQVESAIAAADGLAFTGSSATGRHLAALAGRHLKKCVLELGGSNAFIVLADADIAAAAHDACYARFRDAGQSCNAAKRIILVPQIADDFLAQFAAHTAKLRYGDPMRAETTLASLHLPAAAQNLQNIVDDALARGARCLTGGRLPERAHYYPATILDNVSVTARAAQEEVFGPVAAVFRAQNAAHAVEIANSSPYGLGASVYTADTAAAKHWAKRLQTGAVYINRHTSSDLRLPFGGVKDSGFGRELSEFGLYEFVNVKTYWQK